MAQHRGGHYQNCCKDFKIRRISVWQGGLGCQGQIGIGLKFGNFSHMRDNFDS